MATQTPTRTHVKQKALEMVLEVSAGSDTEVTIGIPDCGGFIAAYGNQGPTLLKSLQNTLARTVESWFQDNPVNFSIGGSNRA